MLKLALRRTAALIATLLIIVTLSFAIIRLAPGGPFEEEQGVSPAVRANLERLYGLDAPLHLQYLRYLRALAHGDFGPSLRQRDFTVSGLIRQGLPLSATLGVCAIALALITGIAAGMAAAIWRSPRTDFASAALGAFGVALPSFVVGPVLALIFGVHLHWLPVAGWQAGAPRYLLLPVLTLALPLAVGLARLTRASLLEVLRAPFVRSARARGLGEARNTSSRLARVKRESAAASGSASVSTGSTR